jgi:hypothetical protein
MDPHWGVASGYRLQGHAAISASRASSPKLSCNLCGGGMQKVVPDASYMSPAINPLHCPL